jgi:hypothetical protein
VRAVRIDPDTLIASGAEDVDQGLPAADGRTAAA